MVFMLQLGRCCGETVFLTGTGRGGATLVSFQTDWTNGSKVLGKQRKLVIKIKQIIPLDILIISLIYLYQDQLLIYLLITDFNARLYNKKVTIHTDTYCNS